jgi:hypothetical protein
MVLRNGMHINHPLVHAIRTVIHHATHHLHTIPVTPLPLHRLGREDMHHTNHHHLVSLRVNLNRVPGKGRRQAQRYGLTERVPLTGGQDIWIHLVDVIPVQSHLVHQDLELLLLPPHVAKVVTSTDGHPLHHRHTDVRVQVDVDRKNTKTHSLLFEDNPATRVSARSRMMMSHPVHKPLKLKKM